MNTDLIYRLRKRAEIRRQIPSRKSVQGEPDRLADLLEEAANVIEHQDRFINKAFAIHPKLDIDVGNLE